MKTKGDSKRVPTLSIVGVLLTTKQAATIIGCKPGALVDWRYRRVGPPFLRLSHRLIRYEENLLRAWLAKHLQQPAA